MSAMTPLVTGVSLVYSSVCSGADQRKHQSSASLAYVRGIHRWPVYSLYKGPVTRKMFPFDDVIMMKWLVCIVINETDLITCSTVLSHFVLTPVDVLWDIPRVSTDHNIYRPIFPIVNFKMHIENRHIYTKRGRSFVVVFIHLWCTCFDL